MFKSDLREVYKSAIENDALTILAEHWLVNIVKLCDELARCKNV